ncbi:putative mediator of RNA polymerase II transcription subunit 26 [Macrosteles quadrilineatus]|uniref:putative mediator of RNA polymerase II transcription subunit 26 n=1 Tax=Macrosteles quadrilineatus TaxID=74068 RepID=UPI0023E0EBAF|nr:putative mediator of RNA polymerase II transcription subunit 26 [Macrosteles quadrilineatus]
MILYTVIITTLCLRLTLTAETPLSTSEDISQINNLKSDEVPRVNIDPRLRRALLRVLTKLEEEDKRNGRHDSARQMAEVMQNIISEADFVKYFQEQGLEKELLESFESNESNKEDQKDVNFEEILSYSSEDTNKPRETPFTFASYPEDGKEDTTQKSYLDFQKTDKYPSTNPTPSLGDAIFFQIPEPLHIHDSLVEDNENEEGKSSVNVQETRSIQGPTFTSPTENNSYQENREEKVTFIESDDASKDIKTDTITVSQPEKSVLQEEEEDEASKIKIDFQASNGTEVEDTEDTGNSSMKVKLEKHEVEFLHSSLLAAFTVQQDQQGLPRRVIPLNYQASGDPIPLPNNKQQQQQRSNVQASYEEKQNQLQQQVKFLQEQQLQEQQYRRLQEFVKERQRLLEQEAQRQLLLENQKRQFENEQRLALARQRQQQILFQNQQDNSLDNLKELERQRYYNQQQFNFNQINQNQPQNVHFQKSVDYQFQTKVQPQTFNQLPLSGFQSSFGSFNTPFQPSVELNRVNRQEASNSVGNFGLSTPRPSLNFRSAGFSSTVAPFSQPTQNYIKSSVLIQPSQSTFIHPSDFIQNNQIIQSQYVQPSNFFQQTYNQHRFAPVTRSPLTVDSQIQSLLSITGIGQGKPSAQEDLNIVTKVLALGHGEPQFHRQQFQASTRHEQVVKAPSRVIQPPEV